VPLAQARRGDRPARAGDGGCTSAEWLAWRCGLTPRTAREHVRIARCLRELPLIRAAFRRVELSYAKVRALTRVAAVETEEELLELACGLTAAQLERALRAYRRVTTEDADAVQAAAYLEWYWDKDGSLVMRGRLAPEDGAVLVQALEAAHDALREGRREGPGGSAETAADERRGARRGGGCRSGAGSPRAGWRRAQSGRRPRRRTRSRETGEGGCEIADGPAIAAETARRLTCDSSLVRVSERDGTALSVGRKPRAVPPAVRRALRRRDRGCRCENQRFVDAHHVRHWAHGGESSLDNLVLPCRRHHRLVHEGRYSIEHLPRGKLRFRDPRGGSVPDVPRAPPGCLERLRQVNRSLAIDAGTCQMGAGGTMDLGLAVEALLAIQKRPSWTAGSDATGASSGAGGVGSATGRPSSSGSRAKSCSSTLSIAGV
jgi:Domain of unknown function (DUF222)